MNEVRVRGDCVYRCGESLKNSHCLSIICPAYYIVCCRIIYLTCTPLLTALVYIQTTRHPCNNIIVPTFPDPPSHIASPIMPATAPALIPSRPTHTPFASRSSTSSSPSSRSSSLGSLSGSPPTSSPISGAITTTHEHPCPHMSELVRALYKAYRGRA